MTTRAQAEQMAGDVAELAWAEYARQCKPRFVKDVADQLAPVYERQLAAAALAQPTT